MKSKNVLKKGILVTVLAVLLLPVAVWAASVVYANVLTLCLEDTFEAEEVEHWGLSYGYELECKVLSYTFNKATVYYYCDEFGEKLEFTKKNGKWESTKSLGSWSDTGGSADDYLQWPYFKNCVF